MVLDNVCTLEMNNIIIIRCKTFVLYYLLLSHEFFAFKSKDYASDLLSVSLTAVGLVFSAETRVSVCRLCSAVTRLPARENAILDDCYRSGVTMVYVSATAVASGHARQQENQAIYHVIRSCKSYSTDGL